MAEIRLHANIPGFACSQSVTMTYESFDDDGHDYPAEFREVVGALLNVRPSIFRRIRWWLFGIR